MSRTDVVAPVAGVVSRRSARVGATVSMAGEPLFRIIEDGAIDLEADVAEQSSAEASRSACRPAQAARHYRRGRRTRAARQPGGRQRQPHRQGEHRACRRRAMRESALLPPEKSIWLSATASAAPASALRIDGEDARLMVVRDGHGRGAQGCAPGSLRATRWKFATGSRKAKALSRARPLSCGRAIGCAPMAETVSGG